MLLELDVRDFAIIDHLRVRLAPGFNAITGETGAGKSIVVDAVGQLLGARADTALVRAGAERAVIEGIFDPGDAAGRVAARLAEYGVEPDDALILSREVYAAGRSTARVNGRPVPVRALADLGELLVDIHGQSDNLSLLREGEHLGLLDRYAGVVAERKALAERVAHIRTLEAEIAELRRGAAEQARRSEALAFQIDEIRAARLSPDEEAGLVAERTRLANAERLARRAEQAYAALAGTDDAAGGLDRLGMAIEALDDLARIDPDLDAVREPAAAAAEALRDVAGQLRDYLDGLDLNPPRLEAVEERLLAIAALKRKYGADIAAVLDHADRAAAELERLTGAEAHGDALVGERDRLAAEIGAASAALSERRQAAAERLRHAIEAELGELGMPQSRFEVAFDRQPDPAGVPAGDGRWAFDATGIDRVAFQVSMNPGEPPRPLVRVASGGETARLMLALKGILSAADEVPTLIFDEIDAGIGGRVGAVVGRKLWAVGNRHQVLCVTHLPQVAAFGDRHFRVSKAVVDGRTATVVDAIEAGTRVDELMHMLGVSSPIARENATQILQESELWKVTARRAAEGHAIAAP